MPPIRTIIVFGDLTYSFQRDLQQLLHIKDNANLADFFARVSFAFRREFALLSQREQEWLPRFTDLVDLLENVGRTEGAPAVQFALLCLYQIGRFIGHFGKPAMVYPTPENTYLLGLCTGSFAAAAISTSQTIVELIPAGVEAVIHAFRTGLHSFKLQRDLERSSSAEPRSWSAVVSLPEQRAADLIEHFVAEKGIPKRHRPFISAVSPTNVTISGPPSSLEDLLSSTTPRAHFLPIETPYHAPHLYGSGDVGEALGKPVNESLESYRLRIPILSPASGTLVKEGSFEAVLRQATHDTLCEQVRWDKVPPACADLISQDEICQGCTILPCASTAATLLSSTLSSIGRKSVSISNALNTSVENTQPAMPTGRFGDSKIAVIGFSGRFPDAASNDEFWELLRSGKDTHRTIPKDRFDWEAHFDPSGATKNTSRVKYGCFVNEPGMFDARFFHLSPREAEDTDPAQRLALMTTYEALEMAGFVPDRTASSQRDRVGVFFGTTSDDWREVNSGQDVGTYFIPGGNRAFVPGRITFFFRFSGPSISVDTACSSSFAALHTACQSLWQGGCDTAIAGGTNILTNPDNFAGLDRGHFLSTTGNCNPFDDDASGYCRADGVASLVLKRLEDAEADNDPIFGVIAGVNTNHCGQTVSITRPHEGDQLSLFKRILRQSNTNPIDVSYVEMHGTGTQAGDAAEMSSVLAAMVPGRERMPHHPLYLGAVKANVGHSGSASGVSALIKVLMMMQYDEIPPHVGIKNRINKNYPLDLAERNVNIAFKPTPWRRADCPGGKRVSFLNNFSAAGGNTAVLLEDAPERQQHNPGADARALHPVVITANSSKSLKANMGSLLRYLDKNPGTSLPALSYTTTARRTHHKFRVSFVGSEIGSVKSALECRLESNEDMSAIPSAKRLPRVAFTFTGQGTLYAGLGKQLFETVHSFRQDILRFDRIAQQHGFPSFLPLITSGPDELIVEEVDTVVAHVALVCVQMALHHLWASWGVVPSLTIGHSLGEYPALYAAGVLSASDTIYLVGVRAELLSLHCARGSHCMLAVKAPLSTIERTISASSCDVACANSPTDTVISGPSREVDRITENLRAEGLECVLLNIPFAFHSAQVESWVDEFEFAASKIQYHVPTVPYISPLLGRTVSAGEAGVLNGSYLSRACRATVNFFGAIEAARDAGIVNEETNWLEIGSHPACSSFIKRTMGSKTIIIPSLRQATDPWKTLVPAVQTFYLGGLEIDWNEYHRGFSVVHQVLPLPSYKWDLKNYWIMYRGNFCLTKGNETVPTQKLVEAPPAPYLSSSVHRVLEERHATDKSTLLTESDIHDPRLYPILQGHKVNGAALCPSSLYADMTLTVVRYMLQANNMPADIGLDCTNMKVDRPLIASPDSTSQLLRVSASADWSRGEVSLALFSVNAESRRIADHAICTVKVTQAPAALWLQEWKRLTHLIQGRISSLQRSVDDGYSHKLKRGLAYKLFSSLVEYANNYQGMEEVVLDTEGFEATARVVFQVGDEGFSWNPCWIDSLGHIAGFIMNGNDNIHSKDHVFVNHGWSAMRCGKRIEYGKTYQTYNKMQPEDEKGNMYVGDTYILENGMIVAIFEGVKFQRVPRSVLDHLLPSKARPNATGVQQRSVKIQSIPIPEPKVVPRKQKPAPVPVQNTVITRLKAIISEEAGIDTAELDSDTSFADFGIDSLLSLTISSRLQDELGLNLSSSSFVDFSTLNDMVNHVAPLEPASSSTSGISTPYPEEDEDDLGDETDATSVDEEPEVMATVRATIAEEVGVPLEELTATTDLSELGVDSLLSLTIIGKLNELGVEVPSDLLAEKHTLQEIEKTLSQNGMLPKPQAPDLPVLAQDRAPDRLTPIALDGSPHATSVRLQGSSSNPRRTLFLFPDGAGSAASYTPLPAISPDVVVYGLNCPWMKNPQDLRCSLPQYVSKFITEIHRRQPVGPYYFGGWSAGGILAYEAAQQLAREGQTTAKLILLDSPDPVGIQSPPQRMYDFLESLDMFGLNGRKPPSWLRPHFTAFITMLDQYRPVAFSGKTTPTTHIIYARDGLCKNPGDPRPEVRPDDAREMHWLLNNRTDFSGGGWRELVGGKNLRVSVVDEANHYTMVAAADSARAVSQLIANYLAG
ncbi:polyketide synthase [Cenococcum geophilum 1.58]|uniref:polyketide synthase n=1 Tax=Cenococcum geophilum 1.58 TaxID=794803 RepID=UPI00358EEFE3|nr:polyketide synthase [Cenococcum geophilum 1.58]